MLIIKMITTKFVKTSNKWALVSTSESDVTEKQYTNIIDAAPFFRRLGGHERHTKQYTAQGYKTVQVAATDPSKQHRTVRTFDMDNAAHVY